MTARVDERDTWGSEKWVIEQLITAVEEGDAELKRRCATRWLDGYASHDWRAARFVDWGLFHPIREQNPRDYAPDSVADLLEYSSEHNFTESRIAAIREGAPLRSHEKRIWRERLLWRAFDDESAYYGQCREWVILRVSAGVRRVAHFGVLDWLDGEAGSYVAAYQTSAEVLNAIKSICYVSLRDYQERSASPLP